MKYSKIFFMLIAVFGMAAYISESIAIYLNRPGSHEFAFMNASFAAVSFVATCIMLMIENAKDTEETKP